MMKMKDNICENWIPFFLFDSYIEYKPLITLSYEKIRNNKLRAIMIQFYNFQINYVTRCLPY